MATKAGNKINRIAAIALSLLPLAAADSNPSFHHFTQAPAGITLVDWQQIQAEYHRHRHGMFPDPNGGHHARTHKHGWLARFDGTGVTLTPDNQPWTWGLELARWGRPGREIAATTPQKTHTAVNRLEYHRPGITEWFVNGTNGLEHGFTIPTPPPGPTGELAIHLHHRGALTPRPTANGQSITYETRQGAPALHYRKLIVTDARGRRLSARLAASEKSLQILLDDRHATYPLTIDPVIQQAYLKASNTATTDRFAYSVAISGDTLVLGTDQEDSNATGINGDQSNNAAANAGAAYVFVRNGATWTQQAYLKASNTGAGDAFGIAVAIDGDTLVVGADKEDSNATGINAANGTGGCIADDTACQPGTQSNNGFSNAGAAYVFIRSGATWTQQAYIKASNTGAGDVFGGALTLTGDTLAVGALAESSNATGVNGDQSDNSAAVAGAAYVFVRSAGAWSQQAYLKASNTESFDRFGATLALSGDTLVVGAWGEGSTASGVDGYQADNCAPASGAAYVFVRSGATWTQQAYLKASNPDSDDNFAFSVAISGDTIAIGAREETSNATGVNGDQNNNSLLSAGAAYVFVRAAGVWSQQAYLKASNTGEGDNFGYWVAVEGDTVVVDARYEGSNATGIDAPLGTGPCAAGDAACQPGTQANNGAIESGALYLFRRNAGNWSQQAYIKASNTGTGDRLRVVALSGDTILAGAWGEDSNATGFNAPTGTGTCADGDAACQPGTQANNAAADSGAAYVLRLVAASLAAPTNTVPGTGATLQTVIVNAESWLPWTATSNAAWLTITAGASGVGPGSVTYDCAPLTSINGRTGTLSIGGLTHTVTQNGLTGAVTLSPSTDTAAATGATGRSLTVTSNATDFAWTATSSAPWLTITAGATGLGSGTVTYDVAAITSINSRTATITVAGQTLTITQSGLTGAVTLSPANDTATAGGANGKSVTVTANATDFPWTATANVPWLTITAGASGVGSGAVTYNIASNASSVNTRTGTLTIGGQTLTVTQTGVTGAITLSPASDTAPAPGATGKTVTLTSNATDFAWTATSNAPWLSITTGATGTGNGTVTYNVAPNTTSINSRTGTLTIAGQTLTITQTGVTGAITLSPTSDTAPAIGATAKSITVTSNATDFTWTANANAPWLTIATGASGVGSGTVTYNVASNATSVNNRTGTLTIGGQTFTITQSGVTGAITVSPASDTAPATGATAKSITVTSNATDFAWTAAANVPWITITAGATGTGNGTVIGNIASNASSVNSRTGTITIAGQPWTITQSGITGALTLAPTSDTAPPAGATGRRIAVTANAPDFAWTASANVPWLTITNGATGTGNGTITYNVAANTGSEDRTGALTIGGRTFAVSQQSKPELLLSATRVAASFVTGEPVPPIAAELSGTPGLAFTARSDVPWLQVAPPSGVVTGGLKLTITPSNQLSPGEYAGTITVQAEGAEARIVLVRLTVTEPTQFIALPAAIELEGATPAQLYITSRGRQVSYRAEAISEGGWLSVSPETGTTPVNLRVVANPYFLKPGRYTAAIRLTAAEPGGGGPITIPVTLNVPAPPAQP